MENAGLDAFGDEGLAEWSAVVTSVGDKRDRRRQGVEDEAGALVVAHLALRQQQDDRPALAVADGMKLGVQPAPVRSMRRRTTPF
jgi:hypothetical protein